MRHLHRCLAGSLMLLGLGTPLLSAASFEGRVFEVRQGRQVAVEGVRVEVRQDSDLVAAVHSDGAGNYLLEDLPDTRLIITASHSDWTTVRAGPRGRDTLLFDCSAGGACATVDFELSRGGVVTGQVLDPFGEPAIGAEIRLSPPDTAGASFSDLLYRQADDRGVYRLAGVAPGSYRLRAHLSSPGDVHGYEYLPVESAVQVEVSGETPVAPLVLGLGRKYRVFGRVEGISLPVPILPYVREKRLFHPYRHAQPIMVREDRRFMASGIPEGTVAFWTLARDSGGNVLLGEFDVNRDMMDVVLRPQPTGRLSGQVQWLGDRRPHRMTISPHSERQGFSGSLVADGPDLTFGMDLPAGEYTVREADGHAYVYQVLDGDAPVAGSRFTIQAHENRRLTFVASDRFATIRGKVRRAQQSGGGPQERPADHYGVVLEGHERFRTVATDQFGYFVVKNLPAGDYAICAFAERPVVAGDQYMPPGGICSATPYARRLAVEPGSEVEVSFTAE